ncbi:hypothetical protein M422DRAFT_36851 [Sphaerobolus stellatus SS14]|uniref:Uncharacterized protein n=1 Tax=Sphaerobolus stellatus (strain SS14) TaxID=990650 RepID=A0A0C9UXB9_SPHS4|nr:hypothetical protein M422DRAFT_36851 [Sphaerobolus stellatus SS14]
MVRRLWAFFQERILLKLSGGGEIQLFPDKDYDEFIREIKKGMADLELEELNEYL